MLKTIVCKNSMEHSLQYIVQGILCNLQKYNLHVIYSKYSRL